MKKQDVDNTKSKIVDFSKVREAKIEEKKRKYERVLFKQILGVYCVIEGKALRAVELVDVSEEGLSLQVPRDSKNVSAIDDALELNKETNLRFYFSQDSYVGIQIKVINKKDSIENGSMYYRFGCQVDTNTQGYEAYRAFVQFLQKYAEYAHQEKDNLKLFFF
jgi:hypothetical protein